MSSRASLLTEKSDWRSSHFGKYSIPDDLNDTVTQEEPAPLSDEESDDVEEDPPQRETTESIITQIKSQRSKNWITRNISGLSKGGVRSSIFTLFSGTVGAGILSLPHIISYYGVVLGTFFILIFAMLTLTMFTILNDLIEKSGKKSYANVCSYYLGKANARIVAKFLVFAQFCSTMIYSSITWQFVGHLLKHWKFVDLPYIDKDTQKIDEHSAEAWKWRSICMGTLFFIVLPFNLSRKLASLRYFSVFIMCVVFFTLAVAMYQSPEYYDYFKDKPDYKISLFWRPFKVNWLQGFATIMLSFNCQITFFYVRGEMRHKTRKRVTKVLRNLISIEVVFYLIIALSGYISLGEKMIPGLFTLRRSIPGKSDTLMVICQCLFILAAILHIPITLFPSREQIYLFSNIPRSTKNHYKLTFAMTFISIVVPCVYPDIVGLLGLLGGITIGGSGYILPLILKIKSMDNLKWNQSPKLMYYIVYFVIVYICMASTIYSIYTGQAGH